MEEVSKGKIALYVISIILGILVLTWVIQGNEFFLYKTFAPEQEQTRRETFEQSKAYRQGMIQELQNMQFKYVEEADEAHKVALADVILHRAADFPRDEMPPSLRSFVERLDRDRTAAH